MPFVLFLTLLHGMGLRIEMKRLDILILSLILGENMPDFTIKCDVSSRLCIYSLYQPDRSLLSLLGM